MRMNSKYFIPKLASFDKCKWFYFTLLLSFAIGAILGIFFCTPKVTKVIIVQVQEYFLIIFKCAPVGKIFARRFLSNLALIVIFALSILSIWVLPFHYIINLYRGYLFGTVLCYIVLLYGVSGVLISIFLMIPIQFAYDCVLTILSINAYYIGKNYCGNIWYLIQLVFLAIIVITLITCVEILLVVVVIRPLNFIV